MTANSFSFEETNRQPQSTIGELIPAPDCLDQQQQFEQITEFSAAILYIYDLEQQRNVYVNGQISQVLGYTPAEIQTLGDQFFPTLVHPEDLPKLLTGMQQFVYMQDGEFLETEYRMRHLNGEWRWLYSRDRVFQRNPDGSVRQTLGTATDITRLKQAEAEIRTLNTHLEQQVALRTAELQESATRLLEAQRLGQMGSWTFDLKTQTITWSSELFHIFGLTAAPSAPSYAEYLALLHPEDAASLRDLVAQAIQSGSSYRLEQRYTRPDGSLGYLEGRGEAILDANGAVVKLHGTAVEITDRKRLELELQEREASLRASQSRFAGMVEIASDAIISVDTEQRITLFNRGAEQIFGYPAAEILGQPLDRLLPKRYAQSHRQHILSFSHTNQTARRMGERSEVFGRRKDGSEFPAEASISKLELAGEPVYTVILRDISERKHIEITLRQQAERERIIKVITGHIRQSLDLTQILNTTVTEVRQLLQADRVMVYRFLPDWSGVIDVEAVQAPWNSVLGSTLKDHCFAGDYVERYRQGRIQVVADIYNAGLAECHIQFLEIFQVRANLVVPILHDDHLWGLLITQQCSSPRQWQPWEVDLLQQLATQAGIAIYQSQLYERTRQQAQREEILNRVIQSIRNSLDLQTIFDTAATAIGQLLRVEQVDIVQYFPARQVWQHVAEYRRCLDRPSSIGLEIADRDNPLSARLKKLEIVRIERASDLTDPVNRPLAEVFPGTWLLVPLQIEGQVWGSLSLSKNEELTWSSSDVSLVETMGEQLAIAIQQANAFTRAQEELAERQRAEAELQSSLEEKTILLQEIHHRVKNNLQVICSLLKLQVRRVEDPQVRSILEDSQNRVLAMSLVHQNLYQSQNFAQINFADYVRSLTHHLFCTLNLQPGQVTLHTDIAPGVFVSLDQAVPCGLILNELVTNALKHGFPDSQSSGDLWIHLKQTGGDFQLTVANNGQPMPSRAEMEQPQSLGLKLIQLLTEQLEGKLEIYHSPQTAFELTFTPQNPLL